LVIDGQQRLTTVTLLLTALGRSAREVARRSSRRTIEAFCADMVASTT